MDLFILKALDPNFKPEKIGPTSLILQNDFLRPTLRGFPDVLEKTPTLIVRIDEIFEKDIMTPLRKKGNYFDAERMYTHFITTAEKTTDYEIIDWQEVVNFLSPYEIFATAVFLIGEETEMRGPLYNSDILKEVEVIIGPYEHMGEKGSEIFVASIKREQYANEASKTEYFLYSHALGLNYKPGCHGLSR